MAGLSKYIVYGAFFFGGMFLIGNSDAAGTANVDNLAKEPTGSGSSTRQEEMPRAKQHEAGPTLDRVTDDMQKENLASLKRINTDLRKGYVALAKNYSAYKVNYDRTKGDMAQRRPTPNYVMQTMQNLAAERERMETDIIALEKKKAALIEQVFNVYNGKLPPGLSREWDREEKEYRDYVIALYRQIGWSLQFEYSPQWRNDEAQFWNYLQGYYQQHPKELDILK